MTFNPKKVAVFGSGIMGSGIAAFFANRGVPVLLYDMEKEFSQKAIEKLKGDRSELFSHRFAKQLTAVSLQKDLALIKECNLVVEAVPEILSIKQNLFKALDDLRCDNLLYCTNTSGLSLKNISEGRSTQFKSRFFGTHFFNPVRYMSLIEFIPGAETDKNCMKDLEDYFVKNGKTVVYGFDTPNFIANRIGMYSLMKTLNLMKKYGLTVPEVDAITGTLIGRPKTATFRLIDLVGIDTAIYASQNNYENCPQDEERNIFNPPDFLMKMKDQKLLGDKTKKGFYQKTVDRKILTLNLNTFEYEPPAHPSAALHAALTHAEEFSQLNDRVWEFIYFENNPYTLFLKELLLSTANYAINRFGEISDNFQAMDDALVYGFNYSLGPVQSLAIFGLPKAQREFHQLGFTTHVTEEVEKKLNLYLVPKPKENPFGECLETNRGGALYDKEGHLILELKSSLIPDVNPIDSFVIELMEKAFDYQSEKGFKSIIVSNNQKNFCGGANLKAVLELAKHKKFKALEKILHTFQSMTLKMHYASFPTISTPHGITLGGGMELALGTPYRVAYSELYCGLVELGVGLIPAGGGTYLLLKELYQRSIKKNPGIVPLLKTSFDMIGYAKTSSSAHVAQEMGYLSFNDKIVFNKNNLLSEALAWAETLSKTHKPSEPFSPSLPGKSVYYVFEDGINAMVQTQVITPYTAHMAKKLCHVLTGGDTANNVTPMSMDAILTLEREAFLSLVGEKLTQDRMLYMLKHGKPLMN